LNVSAARLSSTSQRATGYLTEYGTGFVFAEFGLGTGETVSARIPATGGVTVLVAAKAVELDVNAALYIANGQFLSGAADRARRRALS